MKLVANVWKCYDIFRFTNHKKLNWKEMEEYHYTFQTGKFLKCDNVPC